MKRRAIILNTKIFSQLWYKHPALGIPNNIVKTFEKIVNTFLWKGRMSLIRRNVLELPLLQGGINLVNIPLKVQAFQIKHVLELIYGNNNIEWKAFGRYWLGIRLKLIKEVKINCKGPFAETANHFYQKCYERFKYFLHCKIQQEQRHSNSIKLQTLHTKDIYDMLLQSKNIRPPVEEIFPLTNFKTICKLFDRVQMQALYLDLEYKIIHRAINVKAKLHRLQITNNNTCPLCLKACETIAHFFCSL